VAWISGRTDVFCALFGLLAIWLDGRAREGGGAVPRALAAIALALALLSKESGVPLAGVLVVMEWTRMRRIGATWPQSVVWLAPYLLVTAAYLGLHARFAPDPGVISAPDLQSRAGMRGAGWALFPGYFAFLWPWFPHSPDRAAPTLAPTPAGEVAIGALGAVAAATLFAILLWRRHRAAPAVALALFPLVPPLVLASTRGYGLFGERHMYLPSAGVVWALALALPPAAARLGGRGPQLVWGVCAVLVAGSAVETLRAIPAYRDDEIMYRTMIAREPGNPSGFVGLAEVLTEHGQLDESLTMLARAEALDPALASVFVARARIAAKRQDWPAALAAAERAVGIDAGLWPAWLLHAQALIHLGRAEEGARELERLHRDYPGQPDVASALGQSWLERGHPLEAMAVLQEAVSLSPGEPALWNALGIAAGQAGRWPDARAAFQRTTELAPRALAGWLRLAAACQRLGDATGRDQALTHAAALPGGTEAVSTFQRRLGGATP
jgi:tetratricopeptide (TPR) repeat protein